MKVLLRRTLEVPPHGRVGRVGIDLHLGQKPKLGGRYANDWFALFSIFGLKFEKSKIFCFVCYFLLFLFQKSKTQKYLLFFFGFVKFVVEFSPS
jgi:hypothetical protein